MKFRSAYMTAFGWTCVATIVSIILGFYGSKTAMIVFPIVSIISMIALNACSRDLITVKEARFRPTVGGETIQAFGNICFVFSLLIVAVAIWGNYTRYALDISSWESSVVVVPLFEGILGIGIATFLSNDIRQMGVLLGATRSGSSSASPESAPSAPTSITPPDFSEVIKQTAALQKALDSATKSTTGMGRKAEEVTKALGSITTLVKQTETLIGSIKDFVGIDRRRDGKGARV